MREGRWLLARVETERDVADVEVLLAVKRRPLGRSLTPAG
jgi:hypothetical protein